jgi:hypothetical protein
MRKVVLALTLGLGLILFAVSATRLGIHASEIRRTESAKAHYGELEDIVAAQDAVMAAATDPSVTVGHAQTEEEKARVEARLVQASRQREVALLELGSHSSKEEAENLDEIYARRTGDDRGLEVSLVLLIAGLFLASSRKTKPLTAGQSAG